MRTAHPPTAAGNLCQESECNTERRCLRPNGQAIGASGWLPAPASSHGSAPLQPPHWAPRESRGRLWVRTDCAVHRPCMPRARRGRASLRAHLRPAAPLRRAAPGSCQQHPTWHGRSNALLQRVSSMLEASARPQETLKLQGRCPMARSSCTTRTAGVQRRTKYR